MRTRYVVIAVKDCPQCKGTGVTKGTRRKGEVEEENLTCGYCGAQGSLRDEVPLEDALRALGVLPLE